MMKKRPKLYEVLNWTSLFLESNNCESKIAEILLCHHLKITKSKLYTMLQEPVASVT
ncbi:MAG TPA: protein-(glutamine-N5) methyltransferase, release factor-specific, partial [Bacillota bacterium]|nr:protein-(glutamine-N5) methyltransferase, release factor-specific [Bacillota bacterium]